MSRAARETPSEPQEARITSDGEHAFSSEINNTSTQRRHSRLQAQRRKQDAFHSPFPHSDERSKNTDCSAPAETLGQLHISQCTGNSRPARTTETCITAVQTHRMTSSSCKHHAQPPVAVERPGLHVSVRQNGKTISSGGATAPCS